MPPCADTGGFKDRSVLAVSSSWESRICEATILVPSVASPTSASRPMLEWPADSVTVLTRANNDYPSLRQYDFLPNTERKRVPGTEFVPPCLLPQSPTSIFPIAPSGCHLRVGPSGKGFWVQTENVETKYRQYPVRCIRGLNIARENPSQEQRPDESKTTAKANVLHMRNGLYARRCLMGEIIMKRYYLSTVDLEDVVGRIAVGDSRGKIEVLDYA